MKFILKKDKLKIDNKKLLNSGSVKYYEIEVEHDETWNNLSMEAIIVKGNPYNEGFSVAVFNDKVYIDTKYKGNYLIGFIGYIIENNVKTYQISSDLRPITFGRGAGEIKTTNAEEVPSATEWEIYVEQIREIIDDSNFVYDPDYVHTDNNFTDGYKTNIDNNTAARHTHDNKVILDSILATDISNWNNKAEISDIPDVSSFITKDVNDLTYYTKSSDLSTVAISGRASDLNNDSGFINKDVDNLTNYYKINEIYTKTEVDNKLSSVYKYKGTKETYSQLPSVDLTIGDVWNIETADSQHGIKAGDNVAWNGTTWDILSGTVDLSGYQTLIDSSHKLSSDLVDDTNNTNKFTTTAEKTAWNAKEDASNKVTSISSSSTNTQYPSALAVYNLFNSITNGDEVSY